MHGMHALDFTPSWCSGYFACPFFGLDIEAVSTYLAPHLRGSTLDGLDGTPGGTNFHAAAVVLNGKERNLGGRSLSCCGSLMANCSTA